MIQGTNIFSFVILGIIIITIVALVLFTGKIRMSSLVSWRITGLYCILLFVSLLLYYGVAEPGSKPLPDELYRQERTDSPDSPDSHGIPGRTHFAGKFYKHVIEGDYEDIEEIIVEKEWSFPYEKDHLTIVSGSRHRVPSVIVKQKEVDDGIINAKSLTLFFSLADIPELEMSGSRLTVSAERTELIHSGLDFTASQFAGKGSFMVDSTYFFEAAEQILYLEIPAGLEEIDGDNIIVGSRGQF